MNFEYVVGVDVGTRSVRAGVFDLEGTMVSHATDETQTWRPREDYVEQSASGIWISTGRAVREAVAKADVHPSSIVGIAFDAPCSLVAVDASLSPLTVSPGGDPEHNVIACTDNRAIEQIRRINATHHPMLKYVAGNLSSQTAPPRLLWLKENQPQTWRRAARFLDLHDYLLHQATGADIRSLGAATCKWAYDAKNGRWDPTFHGKLGLEELLARDKVGSHFAPVGTIVAELSTPAAHHLGLTTATKVAMGTIDTYATGVGLIGMDFTSPPTPAALERVLALIAGSSSFHLAVSRSPHFVKGICGPFKDAMIPGFWLAEGELSATGSLIDFIIQSTGRFDIISAESRGRGVPVYEYLNSVVADAKQRDMEGPAIVKDLHVLPYFLGSHSADANPLARGIICGLTLDDSIDAVAQLYYATIQAIAYGTRHIVEAMNKDGFSIKRIHASGRGMRNTLLVQEYADITGCEIVLPREQQSTLLGTAILAAVGAGKFSTIMDAAARMSSVGQRYQPRKKHAAFHNAKYQVFRKMHDNIQSYEEIMERF